MLLKFYVDEAKDKIDDLLHYVDGADELMSVLTDSLYSWLRDMSDELEILSHQLDFE